MSLLKPTIKTPFHIDFDWWKKNERDWHVFLRSLLCTEHQEAFTEIEEGGIIDWIDPKTAEVKAVDGVQHTLMSHCAVLPEAVTRKPTVSIPRAYEKTNIRAEGSNSKIIES